MKTLTIGSWAFAFFLLLSACSSDSTREGANTTGKTTPLIETDHPYTLTAQQFQSSGMVLGELELASFYHVVKANGMFDVPPESRAEVSCYFGGTVKSLKLLPGEQIKKGQVLFTLEHPGYVEMQQDYLAAKGQLSYLKADYERQKSLAQDKVTSQKNFLKAEADYIVTKVKVASLKKKLMLMNINPNTLTVENIRTVISIFSPINGYVTEVAIAQGAFLNPSELAVAIVNTGHLHLELNVFEKDLAKISIGQPIHFTLLGDTNESYGASVYLINKTVDAEQRTIGIHGHLSDESVLNKFNPGMYVEAEIYTNSEERMALPKDALVEVEGRYYVLMLENASATPYAFVKKEVKAGLMSDDYTEIVNAEDFEADSKFLVKGAFNLISE